MATTPVTGTPLEPLRWEKRVLLVFGSDASAWTEQRAEVAGDGAADRDLMLLRVPDDGTVDVDGIGEVDSESLRRAYGIDDGTEFAVLLVGKDGGVKMRLSQPIPAEELFATIDAMPMRANEARRKN